MRNKISRVAGCFAFTVCLSLLPLYGKGSLPIPDSEIAALKTQLTAFMTSKRSLSIRRRACKGVIRDAKKLINSKPTSPNRFEVLKLLLTAQRRLLKMEKAERNRDAFYETCEALAKAPDNYSSYRLTAELLLADRDLSMKDADAGERIKALEKMVARYRDTSAELECLMKVIRLAPQLGVPGLDLKKKLMKRLSQRFAGDVTAINFRRTLHPTGSMDVVFSGIFKRLEGPPIVFPQDRLGHYYYVLFWSKESQASIHRLEYLRDEQKQRPNIIEIYSMNLDGLPDGGKGILDKVGLKCTVLRLPGGKDSVTYRTYARFQPSVVRVNPIGHAILPIIAMGEDGHADAPKPKPDAKDVHAFDEFSFPYNGTYRAGIENYDRYSSQFRYLFIGDFLTESYQDSPDAKAIETCFVKPPMRYRLSRTEEFEMYQKANERLVKAIEKPGKQPLWQLCNYRITALMGMANLSGSADHFDQAVKESRKVLSLSLPKRAEIPARFCLAMSALRKSSVAPKELIEGFIDDCGGEKAGLMAHSAASVLAIAGNFQEGYDQHRAIVLESKDSSPSLDPFTSFLRDRYHQFYLFKTSPNFKKYYRTYRFVEHRHLVDNSLTPRKDPLPPFEVKTLDGETLSLPEAETDKLTVLVFVEPPAEGDELPPHIFNPTPKPTKKVPNPRPGGELGSALGIANTHINKSIETITVFLSNDTDRVKAIRDRQAISGTVAWLPGGLTNPIVNRLGLLSADRNANTTVIRRDGTIAWSKHGLLYNMLGKHTPYNASDGLKHHITACDAEAGYRALKAKDYQRALALFAESPASSHKWNCSLAHGRALSHLALKDYDSTLKEIETAITKHLAAKGGFKVRIWSFNHFPDKPCTSMLHMLNTKAKVLDHLGRVSEAKAARNTIAAGATDYPSDYYRVKGFHRPYEAFEDRLSIVAKEIK